MDRQHLLDGFQLEDQLILDDDVDPVPALELDAFVRDGHDELAVMRNPAERQLVRERDLVHRLEKPRSQMTMDLDACPDDRLGQIRVPPCLRASVFNHLAHRPATRPSCGREGERGLTLIEVLIVMVIAISLVTGMAFAGGQIQRSRLKSASSKVASAMRVGFQRASSTGHDLRLVVDIEQSTIWLEESREKMLLDSKDLATGGADPATEAEKVAQEEAKRLTQNGPQAPKAGFAPVAGAAGQAQALPNGIIVKAVDSAHEPKPRTLGRAYVYFFASMAERASVQLMIKGSEEEKDVFSVVLAPLTGKPSIAEGSVNVAHPRDDAEASEAEDDGR